MSEENSSPKKCQLCGSTNIGVRNLYSDPYGMKARQEGKVVGFAADEYCKDCGISLGQAKSIKETVKKATETIKSKKKRADLDCMLCLCNAWRDCPVDYSKECTKEQRTNRESKKVDVEALNFEQKILRQLIGETTLNYRRTLLELNELKVRCSNMGHYIVKYGESAYCIVCSEYFGWWCPDSPNHRCDYSGRYGEDSCIYCGQPEERK